jgi:cytochrome c-type biogenesis protein CcmF
MIGVVLLFMSRKWEKHVMVIFSLSQVFVTSMMLGIHFGAVKIGSSPFVLLRETFGNLNNTMFVRPDYLKMLTDGNGLNPLLENIWMTIHPPILFLGYALALVPFSYAIAGLMKKEFISWIRPALPWTLLSLTLLGAGILLGGAWAYVSLTFGGFWAWDPVENSSLVPWMTLIAGLHFMLIARKQRHALLVAIIFICLSYVLVLYASFLTRSGVLADTSAHSFGDNGMTAQLLVYLLVFLVLMLVMTGLNFRNLAIRKKEILLSKEFWMFVGALIVVLAAFQVVFTTSIPVFNSLFHTNIAPPSDRVGFYNRWQMPYALMIAAFIAFAQFLNYQVNSGTIFLKKMAVPLVLAAVLVFPFVFNGVVTQVPFILFLFFILFSVFSILFNVIFRTSGPKNYGGIITHFGFVIFLLGILITFSNSAVITMNTSKFDLGNEKMNAENLMLMKHDTVYMGGYYLAYNSEAVHGNITTYKVDFLKRTTERFIPEFSLFPSVNRNPRMGDVYNPDTKHFFGRDYYMYISYTGNKPDYIVVKGIMNPYINVLWAGAIIMICGLAYSFFRRIR